MVLRRCGTRGGELSIKAQLAGDGQLLISVADTGVGLSVDNIDKIFDAFFTTKVTRHRSGPAITRSYYRVACVAASGLAPNPGPGATFRFTLLK